MIKYKKTQTNMWDAWMCVKDEKLQLFHLQEAPWGSDMPPEVGESLGRAVSEDGIKWAELPSVLPPSPKSTHPKDCKQRWTGCTVEKDGKAYLFYTMRDAKEGSQRIGLAISSDWVNWELYKEPVLEPDDKLLIGYTSKTDKDWGIIDCRDMMVMPNPNAEGYYGYFAAAADIGRISPVGVIAMAQSKDLIHWNNQRIVYIPPQNGMIEVPEVFQVGEKWYLSYLCGAGYTGRIGIDDEGVTNCTRYACADSPEGEFIDPTDNLLLGGIAQGGIALRTVCWKGKLRAYYSDRVQNGNHTLSFPKEVRKTNSGKLRLFYDSLIPTLWGDKLKTDEISPVPNSFAWRTFGGFAVRQEEKVTIKTQGPSYHIEAFPQWGKLKGAELSLSLKISSGSAGIYLDADEKMVFILDPQKEKISICGLYDFTQKSSRKHKIAFDEWISLKCVLADGTVELYIDDELVIQAGIIPSDIIQMGLFCENGITEYQNITGYVLGNI